MKTKQRGSGWSIKLVFNLYKLFGYKFIYYLMYPVTFFYFLFAGNVKDSLRVYYKHLNIKLTPKRYYEHLRIFALMMVDRFITKVDPKSYTYLYDDGDTPINIFSNSTILLQSHFGGWASSSNVSRTTNKIHIVMQEALMDSIKEIEESLDVKTNISVIDLNSGTLSVSIQIANAFMNNEVVAIMGDRASNVKATISTQFLGEEANFNKNPFQIAYKMNKPILVYFVIYLDIQKYKFEYMRIDVDIYKSEDQAIREALEKYVKMYEDVIKRYPNQWLNFYDFWEKEPRI
ncbi:MAG: lysophospholipid acyltransferase family protein [Campylobacterota bacterium]